MEIFYVYAPNPPWDDMDTLHIFDQTIRQLGNLSHTSSNSKLFDCYYRILEMLSDVKIGVVLVDLIQTSKHRERAEETLQELFKALLSGVAVDHPHEVAGHAENAIAACLEEFETSIPVRVMDEVLLAVGQGPVVYVANPVYTKAVAKKSYHMRGMAVDIHLPDRSLSHLRKTALELKSGGVGYYPKSGFVHIDTGKVRSWG